jgi:HAD superfamily hydrolase (TIGR01490 family)
MSPHASTAEQAARLSLFDLDNTLIRGDCDYGWAKFLIQEGVLDAAEYERRNAQFFADYKAGTLDILAFLDFQLKPLADHPMPSLLAWRARFVEHEILPLRLPAAKAVVDEHLAAGDLVAVVTATNSFITRPIADLYGIEHLIATEPEVVDGRFTGRVAGTPSFQAGKISRVEEWLQSFGRSLGGFGESWFYSDSRNDLPLLQAVTHPVAVDADATLLSHARAHGWRVVSWR